jgi:hypothetical protein
LQRQRVRCLAVVGDQRTGHAHRHLFFAKAPLGAALFADQDAAMLRQFLRMSRRAVLRQIGRRGAGHAIGRQPARHQCGILQAAEADGQVMAAFQQVHYRVAQVQLHRQLRVLALEVRHDGDDVLAAEFSGRGHAQQAAHFAPAVRQQRFRLFDFVEDAQHARMQQGAFGQRQRWRRVELRSSRTPNSSSRHALADHRQRQVQLRAAADMLPALTMRAKAARAGRSSIMMVDYS